MKTQIKIILSVLLIFLTILFCSYIFYLCTNKKKTSADNSVLEKANSSPQPPTAKKPDLNITNPPTPPTEPPNEPQIQPTPPTELPNEPTEPSNEPNEPPTEPTEPPTEPTEPPIQDSLKSSNTKRIIKEREGNPSILEREMNPYEYKKYLENLKKYKNILERMLKKYEEK